MIHENAWTTYTAKDLKSVEKLSKDYIDFLNNGKTERECTELLVEMAEQNGYINLEEVIKKGQKLGYGSKVYAVNMGKAVMMLNIGKDIVKDGMNILGAHLDSPRLDIKQNPLYEAEELGYLNTHYYGGIKKYQYVALPLALHGVVVKPNGDKIVINIGEKDEDPVFFVSDLLIHLAEDQMKKVAAKVVEGEDLDILIGSKPVKDKNAKEAVKTALLKLLKDEYDIEEDDFISAEIEAVPAGKAKDAGLVTKETDRVLTSAQLNEMSDDEIKKISTSASPTKSELTRYILWLEQKYRSPYTGRPISLAKLFTSAYQIEHVIPQSRYFDDSLSNKVICEAEVNLRKTNMLGLEFIKQHGGEIIHCTTLGDVRVLTEAEYTELVKDMYAGNRIKQKKLMMEDIPEEFIQRQMNDSRYISKVIKGLLSNIVREEGEEEATSKNVIVCTGGITDRLKQDWGLNDVWNKIVSPRFQRMNELTNSDLFGHWENKEGKRVFQTTMPLELQRGFSKKRIDHRHHAMDALVIALASRNIVSYLNNESARDTTRREDLRRLLCDQSRIIRKPWSSFTADALAALEDIIVSFKQYIRVINKASNYYEHYNDTGKKIRIPQQSHDQWAVRKPLHKETVFGHVNLRRKKEVPVVKALDNYKNIVDASLKLYIKTLIDEGWNTKQIAGNLKEKKHLTKVEVYYFTDTDTPMVAVRKPLDDSFDKKRIESITDTGIQQILLRYLDAKGGDPKTAFSPEGIMELNETISKYNNGKPHQPILHVRVSEPMGEKYQIGQSRINQKKFVEAQSGTNLYFAIYADKDGKRSYQTIPLNQVVERLKQGLPPAPEQNENGDMLKFTLSPNDLVYVPTEDEILMKDVVIDKNRIYKFVSATGKQAFFVRHNVATAIVNKVELQANNKMERIMDGEIMIKAVCWKLEVNRLGNITNIIR